MTTLHRGLSAFAYAALALGCVFTLACGGGEDVAEPDVPAADTSAPDADAQDVAAEAPTEEYRVLHIEDTPEGKTIEIRADGPEALREAMEQIRAIEGMEAVADRMQVAAENVEASEEGGTEPDVAWSAGKEEIKDLLPPLLEAAGFAPERINLRLD